MDEIKIKQLIESSVVEDVAIGLSFYIKKCKIRKKAELETKLRSDFKINTSENVDIYIGNFNIYISAYGDYSLPFVYHRTQEIGQDIKVIKL